MSELKSSETELRKISKKLDELSKLNELIDIAPDIKAIVSERREQEIFNRRAAKLARVLLVTAGAVGTFIATIIAVSKLIVTIGK